QDAQDKLADTRKQMESIGRDRDMVRRQLERLEVELQEHRQKVLALTQKMALNDPAREGSAKRLANAEEQVRLTARERDTAKTAHEEIVAKLSAAEAELASLKNTRNTGSDRVAKLE